MKGTPRRIGYPLASPATGPCDREGGQTKAYRALKSGKLLVTNVVSTFFAGEHIFLPSLGDNNPFTNMFNNSLSSRIIRYVSPSATCLVFPAGSIVIVGAKYEMQARHAAWVCARTLRRCRVARATVEDLRIRNITLVAYAGSGINVQRFYHDYGMNIIYNPDSFCGATFRYDYRWSWTFNTFTTGRIVFTGINKLKNASKVYSDFHRIITPYLCKTAEETETLRRESTKASRRAKREREEKEARLTDEEMRAATTAGLTEEEKRAMNGENVVDLIPPNNDPLIESAFVVESGGVVLSPSTKARMKSEAKRKRKEDMKLRTTMEIEPPSQWDIF